MNFGSKRDTTYMSRKVEKLKIKLLGEVGMKYFDQVENLTQEIEKDFDSGVDFSAVLSSVKSKIQEEPKTLKRQVPVTPMKEKPKSFIQLPVKYSPKAEHPWDQYENRRKSFFDESFKNIKAVKSFQSRHPISPTIEMLAKNDEVKAMNYLREKEKIQDLQEKYNHLQYRRIARLNQNALLAQMRDKERNLKIEKERDREYLEAIKQRQKYVDQQQSNKAMRMKIEKQEYINDLKSQIYQRKHSNSPSSFLSQCGSYFLNK